MSIEQICPLRSTDSSTIHCKPKCAWNVGSEIKPECAIAKISLNLSSIEDQYSNQ